MQDRKLYEQLLGIHRPWRVRDIDLQLEDGDVVVFVEHMPGERLTCPTCGETSPGYDTRQRRWRHLDTMQYRTVIEAEVPRVRCATHGVVQCRIPWADEGSRLTALFEALVIDWLHEASVSAVARQLRLSWDAVAGVQRRAVRRGLARRELEPPDALVWTRRRSRSGPSTSLWSTTWSDSACCTWLLGVAAMCSTTSCSTKPNTRRSLHRARRQRRSAWRAGWCAAASWPSRSSTCCAMRCWPQRTIQCDETTVQVLKEPGKAAQSTSSMWVQRSALPERPIILFDFDPTRSGYVPKRLLEAFHGILQTDGYDGYNAVVRELGLIRLYCMAHARRYFTDALKAKGINPNKLPPKPPKGTAYHLKALGFFKTLYTIERRIRDKPPDERQRIRQAEARPVLEAFKAWLDKITPRVRPGSKLGEAIAYTRNDWDGLIRYCDHGQVAIDNNAVENALRPFCVGRNGWLFSDSVAGARASANLYSLITTAKANGIEPYAYLRQVFTELPKAQCVEDIEALLPFRLDPTTLTRNAA